MAYSNTKLLTYSTLLVGVLLGTSYASEMRYTPINPDFGGNPFNASGLLAEANAQNHFQAPTSQTSQLQNFTNTITAAVLGQISSSIATQIFSNTGPTNGTLTEGTTKLTFMKNGDGTVTINLMDLITGQTTTLTGLTSSR